MFQKIQKAIKYLLSPIVSVNDLLDDSDNIIVRNSSEIILDQNDIDFIKKHYPYSYSMFYRGGIDKKTENCCNRFGKYCKCNTIPQDFLFLMTNKEKNIFEDNCEDEYMLKNIEGYKK